MKKLICSILLALMPVAAFAAAPPATVTSDIITKSPWVDVRVFKDATHPFGNLSTAKTSPVTVGKMILVASPIDTNNWTIPADREIAIIRGGSITRNPGTTLTFAPGADFHAGDNHNCFLGSGTTVGLRNPIPNWFGITGVQDEVAIQKAIDSLGSADQSPGTIRFDPTKTYITSAAIKVRGGQILDNLHITSTSTGNIIESAVPSGTIYNVVINNRSEERRVGKECRL